MDKRTAEAVDIVLQDELIRNERIVTHPVLGTIKIQRPTPRKERLIAEARSREYNRLIADPGVLSNAELEVLATRRGIWDEDQTSRMNELSGKSGQLMGLLQALEYDTVDAVSDEYGTLYSRALELFSGEDAATTREAIERYFSLEEDPQLEDRAAITTAAPSTEVDDILDRADVVRAQMDLLMELTDVRNELTKLQLDYARIFKGSLESQTSRVEELAQMYYLCTNAETGEYLWPSLDDAWDLDPEIIEFLMTQLFYFANSIDPEYQELLEKHGFTKRVADLKQLSEDSPVHPQTNSDGEPLQDEPTSSGDISE